MSVQKSTFNLFLILSFLLIIILGWFYWFQYRPSIIKEKCAKSSMQTYKEMFNDADSRDSEPKDGLVSTTVVNDLRKDIDQNYELCLHKNGI